MWIVIVVKVTSITFPAQVFDIVINLGPPYFPSQPLLGFRETLCFILVGITVSVPLRTTLPKLHNSFFTDM